MENLEQNRRAKKLIADLDLTPDEIQQIIATARFMAGLTNPWRLWFTPCE